MARKHGRIDRNQTDIVRDLRAIGAHVTLMSDLGNGRPDILVAFRGKLTLMELKVGKGELTEDEALYHDEISRLGGVTVLIVRHPDDAMRGIGA